MVLDPQSMMRMDEALEMLTAVYDATVHDVYLTCVPQPLLAAPRGIPNPPGRDGPLSPRDRRGESSDRLPRGIDATPTERDFSAVTPAPRAPVSNLQGHWM